VALGTDAALAMPMPYSFYPCQKYFSALVRAVADETAVITTNSAFDTADQLLPENGIGIGRNPE
jgi:hypothetical protein